MVAPLKERAAAALWFGLVEPLADVSGRLLWALNQAGQPTIGRRDAARHQAQRAETAAQRARENTAGVRRQR